MKTKLTITWRYPDETENRTATFHDINAENISIHYGILFFANDEHPDGWLFQLNHVVSMEQEEE